ncbi:nuclease-related domain-containing protein [Antiquaquibacter soli]|uniref:Nuclease-related domain-containing protein n=1 Tax=Antiquaquibacter soli TaxID=3064523 RepID=A0ABT9BKX2_9MICO|nr:nuclease-related domain-containing protein [Protaetiibacter sp. WY-16]MDO7881672.1 nuclease-related domain-containing protein [Protaetiibacter sp. WY-16]
MDGRGVRDRIAAQSAMAAVVAAQSDAPARSPWARMLGLSPLAPGSRDEYRAALGELLVGDMLENLGQRWDVLHDIPLGSSTLDHLLIGPAGVFAVRVANHGDRDVVVDGALLVSGEPTDDVAEAARQADLAGEHLSVAAGEAVRVRALLVVVDPRRLVERTAPTSVRVVASADLDRMLHRSPRVLSGDEVARVSDLADLESTWPPPQPQSLDLPGLHRAFAIVRQDVRSALLRRALWAGGALAVGCVGLWLVVARAVAAVVSS